MEKHVLTRFSCISNCSFAIHCRLPWKLKHCRVLFLEMYFMKKNISSCFSFHFLSPSLSPSLCLLGKIEERFDSDNLNVKSENLFYFSWDPKATMFERMFYTFTNAKWKKHSKPEMEQLHNWQQLNETDKKHTTFQLYFFFLLYFCSFFSVSLIFVCFSNWMLELYKMVVAFFFFFLYLVSRFVSISIRTCSKLAFVYHP